VLAGLRGAWLRQVSPTRRVAAWVLAGAGPALVTLGALPLHWLLLRGGYLFFMLLVAIAVAMIGGSRPAVACVVLAAVAREAFFGPPFRRGGDLRPNPLSLIGFSLAGAAVVILIGELTRLAGEQAALRRVATLVAGGARPAEVFTAVADELGRLIDGDASFVAGIDLADADQGESAGHITVVGSYGRVDRDVPVGVRIRLAPETIAAVALRTGLSARVNGAGLANGPWGPVAGRLGLRAAVAVPITVGGCRWGVTLAATAREDFPAGTESRMADFVELAAIAIANAQAEQELRELGDTQAALRRLATLVARGEKPEAMFGAATGEALRHFGGGTAWMIRYEPDGTATLLANEGSPGPRWRAGEPWEGHPPDGVTATVLRTGLPARVDDYRDIPGGQSNLQEGVRAAVAVPIHVNGKLWGAIAVSSGDRPIPPDAEVRLAQFTDLVATAVANAQNWYSLEAGRDELAGLLQEQAALRRIATLVARETHPDKIFLAVSEEVRGLLGADSAGIARFEPDGASAVPLGGVGDVPLNLPARTAVHLHDYTAPARVWQTGRCAQVDEDQWSGASDPMAQRLRELGIRSMVASPITVEGRLWGVVNALSRQGPFPSDTPERMADFTELVATAVGNAESRAQLAASRTRIVAAADEARRRIERDLHDGAQQHLLALALRLRSVAAAPHEGVDLRAEITEVATALTGVLDELQEISRGIHPAILSSAGLASALRALGRRSAIPVEIAVRIAGRLPEALEVGAYYAVSEMLTNAAKHARASVVEVDAETSGGTLRIRVRDDGVGGADPQRGSGLVGLKDRIEALGGAFSLLSPAGGGTTAYFELPVTVEDGRPAPGRGA
jgi:signal transduction histidine kinase